MRSRSLGSFDAVAVSPAPRQPVTAAMPGPSPILVAVYRFPAVACDCGYANGCAGATDGLTAQARRFRMNGRRNRKHESGVPARLFP